MRWAVGLLGSLGAGSCQGNSADSCAPIPETAAGTRDTETGGADSASDSEGAYAALWPNSPADGFDYSTHITRCPTWSGILDEAQPVFAGKTYRSVAKGGTYRYGVVQEMWTSGGVDPASGEAVVSMSGAVSLQMEGAAAADFISIILGSRHYRCDSDGLFLTYNEWAIQTTSISPYGVSVGSQSSAYTYCDSPGLRLVSADPHVGDQWEGTCSSLNLKSQVSPGSFRYFDCTFTFEVLEQRRLSTPAGTFDALHIGVSSTDAACAPNNADFYAATDGFWLGRGMGLLQMNDSLGEHVLVRPPPR